MCIICFLVFLTRFFLSSLSLSLFSSASHTLSVCENKRHIQFCAFLTQIISQMRTNTGTHAHVCNPPWHSSSFCIVQQCEFGLNRSVCETFDQSPQKKSPIHRDWQSSRNGNINQPPAGLVQPRSPRVSVLPSSLFSHYPDGKQSMHSIPVATFLASKPSPREVTSPPFSRILSPSQQEINVPQSRGLLHFRRPRSWLAPPGQRRQQGKRRDEDDKSRPANSMSPVELKTQTLKEFVLPEGQTFSDRLVTLEHTFSQCIIKTATDISTDPITATGQCPDQPLEAISPMDGIVIEWDALEGITVEQFWNYFETALLNETFASPSVSGTRWKPIKADGSSEIPFRGQTRTIERYLQRGSDAAWVPVVSRKRQRNGVALRHVASALILPVSILTVISQQ